MNYPPTSPDSYCGLSHRGRTLDYLLDEKEVTDELTLRKIEAMEEERVATFRVREKKHTRWPSP